MVRNGTHLHPTRGSGCRTSDGNQTTTQTVKPSMVAIAVFHPVYTIREAGPKTLVILMGQREIVLLTTVTTFYIGEMAAMETASTTQHNVRRYSLVGPRPRYPISVKECLDTHYSISVEVVRNSLHQPRHSVREYSLTGPCPQYELLQQVIIAVTGSEFHWRF